MDGVAGHAGWRWIFMMEGIITVAVSLVSVFLIVPFPQDSKRFTPEEKQVLFARLARDGGETPHDSLGKHVIEALTDWKVWLA